METCKINDIMLLYGSKNSLFLTKKNLQKLYIPYGHMTLLFCIFVSHLVEAKRRKKFITL